MQIYAYKCPQCGQTYDTTDGPMDRLPLPCSVCEHPGPLHRSFQLQVQRPMLEHWNATLHKPISDMRQFKDGLKAQGEAAAEYTGIETDYQPIDPSDTKALGVTGEGLDETNRVRVREGKTAINLKGL